MKKIIFISLIIGLISNSNCYCQNSEKDSTISKSTKDNAASKKNDSIFLKSVSQYDIEMFIAQIIGYSENANGQKVHHKGYFLENLSNNNKLNNTQ